MAVVAPFQPTCFPPAYIFQRAYAADTVVLMGSAQMTAVSPAEDGTKKKTGQKHLRLGGGADVTDFAIPTVGSMKPINETMLDSQSNWRDKLITTVRQRYSKSAELELVTDILDHCLQSDTLGELNTKAFTSVCAMLGISTPILPDTIAEKASKGDWVINLVLAAGGDTLLTGKPSTAYMDKDEFARRGVEIRVQDWKQADYQHYGAHEGQMSILHTILSIGVEATERLLKG